MRLSSLIANASPVAGIIISVALMLFSGFAMTRLTKLARLPNVTGYILAGILIGPYVLNLVPQRIRLHYGERYGVHVENNPDRGVHVHIELPVIKGEEER